MKLINKLEGNKRVVEDYIYYHGLVIIHTYGYKTTFENQYERLECYGIYIPFISEFMSNKRFDKYFLNLIKNRRI